MPIQTLALLIALCASYGIYAHEVRPSVTFTLPRGRLGNKLIAYAKAYYVAQKYNFSLLTPPFLYADQLALSLYDKPFHAEDLAQFTTVKHIHSEQEITDTQSSKVLYTTDFNFKCNLFALCKDSAPFKKKLQARIRPLHVQSPVQLPRNRITIGIHVRKGGDYDAKHPGRIQALPHKFPETKAYIKRLQVLLHELARYPVHIHIFTDDPHPELLAQEFKKYITHHNVTFSYREQDNHHAKNVLEDLFSMAHCNYLIRPHSTYSLIAQLIGTHRRVFVTHYPRSRPISRTLYGAYRHVARKS